MMMVDFDDYFDDHYDEEDLCIECGRVNYYEAVCDECSAGL